MLQPITSLPEINRDLTAETFVATAMVRSLNFVLSREFLGLVQIEECDQSIFSFGWKDMPPALMPTWFRVSRIGISSENTCRMYLDAIQRILHSLNGEEEILFLVKNSKKKVDISYNTYVKILEKLSGIDDIVNQGIKEIVESYKEDTYKVIERVFK